MARPIPNHHTTHFQTRKTNCLSKRDKSSAGRIDPRAVDICAAINARAEYYTTSSCSGRCFLYVGDGIKRQESPNTTATSTATGFQRYRVNHDLIHEPARYFNLRTLIYEDPTGGGDPIPTVGQYDYFKKTTTTATAAGEEEEVTESTEITPLDDAKETTTETTTTATSTSASTLTEATSTSPSAATNTSILQTYTPSTPLWLRYEPFILHVMCHSLQAASKLMALARPSFKNVGLTTWNSNANSNNDDDTANNDGNDASGDGDKTTNQQCKGGGPRYLIAIWGDEGLDMPLSLPSSPGVGLFYNPSSSSNNNNDNDNNNGNNNSSNDVANAEWLAQLVNERHVRNWKKIERFVDAMRSLQDAEANEEEEEEEEEDEEDGNHEYYQNGDEGVNDAIDGMEGMHLDNRHGTSGNNNHKAKSKPKLVMPRSYDVIGDVAVLNSIPEGMDEESYRKMGEMILSRNKGLKICLARTNPLTTTDRSPGTSGLLQIAGPPRAEFITSHYEYGIKCVVDLRHTFFSPRMAPERLRLSQQVARGERVIVVFAGVGMEALQIVARTEAKEVLAIEKNEVAVECLRRARRMMERNKTIVASAAAAASLSSCSSGGKAAMDRLHITEGDALDILPTLEQGAYDRIVAPRPKEGKTDGDLGTGDAGTAFLLAMLPLLKLKGEVHWYDFAADHELPKCDRTRKTVEGVCEKLGLEMEVIHVAKVGSVAKRQLRVCMDFRITGKKSGL